jgi:aryl-alcohol dehydrogenase-like predicted oxidoreductase
MIEYALGHGVNFIDTADAYSAGDSERFVGKALANGGKRASTILATKGFFPRDPKDPNARGLSRRSIVDACHASLERLGTDWIDLYQLHRPQSEIPIDETLRALDDLIRAGKVRYVGTSMFAGWKIVEALWAAKELGLNRFVSEQMAYHLLDRTAEREVIPAARTFGVALLPWAPLCGGLLSGKYRRDDQSAEGRWQGGKDNFDRPATPAAFDVIEGLVELADSKGCTPSQLALAWNFSQPGITAPIIGPRTLEQLVDNLGAVTVTLTAEDAARLDELAPPLAATLRYYDAAMTVDFKPNFGRW